MLVRLFGLSLTLNLVVKLIALLTTVFLPAMFVSVSNGADFLPFIL